MQYNRHVILLRISGDITVHSTPTFAVSQNSEYAVYFCAVMESSVNWRSVPDEMYHHHHHYFFLFKHDTVYESWTEQNQQSSTSIYSGPWWNLKTTSMPVIRIGVYPHMPIAITGPFVTLTFNLSRFPKWRPWVQHRNSCSSLHISRQKYDPSRSSKVKSDGVNRKSVCPTYKCSGGLTSYLSPFFRYFESKDCDVDL